MMGMTGPEMMKSVKSLASVPLLSGLSPKARARLEGRCNWLRYSANETIIEHRDTTYDVYFLIEGHAHVCIYSNAGKVVGLRELAIGDIFGEFAAIDHQARSASVEAAKESIVASMSADLFWETLESEPTFMKALIHHLAMQVRTMTTRVYELSTLAVNNRIHCELMRLAKPDNTVANTARISPIPTHTQIASRISTTREAVAREMSNLSRNQLVIKKGRELIITDVGHLREMIQMATGD